MAALLSERGIGEILRVKERKMLQRPMPKEPSEKGTKLPENAQMKLIHACRYLFDQSRQRFSSSFAALREIHSSDLGSGSATLLN